jgi:quercetin 2,3-dioxygenase
MSAGLGVRHSEYNHSASDALHFVQMWVLPGDVAGPPTYGQVDFDVAQRRNKWLVVASGRASQDAPVALTQDVTLLVSRLEGAELRHTFEPGRLGFLFAADGGIELQHLTIMTPRSNPLNLPPATGFASPPSRA